MTESIDLHTASDRWPELDGCSLHLLVTSPPAPECMFETGVDRLQNRAVNEQWKDLIEIKIRSFQAFGTVKLVNLVRPC